MGRICRSCESSETEVPPRCSQSPATTGERAWFTVHRWPYGTLSEAGEARILNNFELSFTLERRQKLLETGTICLRTTGCLQKDANNSRHRLLEFGYPRQSSALSWVFKFYWQSVSAIVCVCVFFETPCISMIWTKLLSSSFNCMAIIFCTPSCTLGNDMHWSHTKLKLKLSMQFLVNFVVHSQKLECAWLNVNS